MARYSFVGFDPAGIVQLTHDGLRVFGALPAPSRDQDPLTYLRRIQAFYAVDDHESPFVGGLVGSIGYDFVRLIEPSLDQGQEETWPRILLGLYLDGIIYDHHDNTATYVSRGEDRSQTLQTILDGPTPRQDLHIGTVTPTVNQTTFEERVRRAQELIRAGEAFQIVLSRAYHAPHNGDLGPLYDWLREHAAVPYLYHLRFSGGMDLLGASPEMLVRVRRGAVETFPIAGTRPITGDPTTDDAAAQDLRADPKETAEHAMLVDLARNDLSRVCTPGTVEVVAYQDLHKFHSVQHLVSHVKGQLQPPHDALDTLAAVFPAGTVSGAPKVRAMEHIDELEGPRGPYAGAVAYLSFNGDFDSAIAIRSLSARDGTLTIQAGAGIVIASEPTGEYHETQHKAGTLLEAVRDFGAEVQE